MFNKWAEGAAYFYLRQQTNKPGFTGTFSPDGLIRALSFVAMVAVCCGFLAPQPAGGIP